MTMSLIELPWMFFTNLPWYYLTPCQNLSRLNVTFMVRKIGQLFKIFKILIVPLFWLIIDDVTVMLSLILLLCIFFANHLYTMLLYTKICFIFMVRKIGKISPWWGGGGGGCLTSPRSYLCLILEPSRYTVKNLVRKKLFLFSRKIGKTCIHPSPWPSKG